MSLLMTSTRGDLPGLSINILAHEVESMEDYESQVMEVDKVAEVFLVFRCQSGVSHARCVSIPGIS